MQFRLFSLIPTLFPIRIHFYLSNIDVRYSKYTIVVEITDIATWYCGVRIWLLENMVYPITDTSVSIWGFRIILVVMPN